VSISTTFLFSETEAVEALVSAIQYLCYELASALPNLQNQIGLRRINTFDKNLYRELVNSYPYIKEGFESSEEVLAKRQLVVEADRKALGKQLRADRERRGGSEAKHKWKDSELECLAAKYDDFKPIWIEAKRIAKDAQKSKERSRRTGWRSEVLRAYPYLPTELLDRFTHPRSEDAKPSDIAIVHAKRECGIAADYSARELRKKVHAWKLKVASTDSAKINNTRKVKTTD
jgi:hypothetical protein